MPSRTLLALLLAAAAPLAAQEAPGAGDENEIYLPPPIAPPLRSPPPPPLAPEHLRLAQRLAGLILLSEIREEVLRAPPRPPADADGDPLTNPPIVARPSARWNIASAAATAYARLYTVDELTAMVAFFESPAGQKFLSARRQGVVNVMHVFQQLPWYPDLYYELCGGQESCRWKPEE